MFVERPGGGLDFGYLPEEAAQSIRRQAGPIRLLEDDLRHIEDRHSKEITQAGYGSVLDFVEQSARSYNAIYRGEKGTLFLVTDLPGSGARNVIVQLTPMPDKSLDFWAIKTAAVMRRDYLRKKELLLLRDSPYHTQAPESGAPFSARPRAANQIFPENRRVVNQALPPAQRHSSTGPPEPPATRNASLTLQENSMEQQQTFQEVEGSEQDLPVGGFSPAQNPEKTLGNKKVGEVSVNAHGELPELPNYRPFSAIPPGELPEHMHAEVLVKAAVIRGGGRYTPPTPEQGDVIKHWEVVRQLSDDRGATYDGKPARHITQKQEFSTLEEAVTAARVSAQQAVKPAELDAALEKNPAQRELYAREAAEWEKQAEKQASLDAVAAEPGKTEKAPEPSKRVVEQEADPLHLGDTQKKPEHLFPVQGAAPEQSEQKAPEMEAPAPQKREFPKKNPPEVLLANPRNNKPHVKDYGDRLVVTRRAMFGMGKAAQAKREQAVTVGLQAAAERFGQPVRFEGNPAFLEETAKQAVKLGIKLEPGNKLAEAIYAKALDAREKELAIATKRDMVFAPSKDRAKQKAQGLGIG